MCVMFTGKSHILIKLVSGIFNAVTYIFMETENKVFSAVYLGKVLFFWKIQSTSYLSQYTGDFSEFYCTGGHL